MANALRSLLLVALAGANATFGAQQPAKEYIPQHCRTTQRHWDSTQEGQSYPLSDSNSVAVTNTYDTYGNLTGSSDPEGNDTKWTYDSLGLYREKQQEAFGETVERTTSWVRDYDSGLATSVRDVDNSLTTAYEYDKLGRMTEVSEGNSSRKTEREYDDTDRHITTSSSRLAFSDTDLVTVNHFDQQGRLWLQHSNDTTKVGAGSTTTSYSSNTTTVSDAAGVSLTSTYDGLGRLVEVSEDGISATTCYSYDALDNLTAVRQKATNCTGGQLRTFAYDSLGRLTSATNPESGTASYTYDGNGNLLTKSDRRAEQ